MVENFTTFGIVGLAQLHHKVESDAYSLLKTNLEMCLLLSQIYVPPYYAFKNVINFEILAL